MIFLGDVHSSWDYLQIVINENPNETIICLGEFGYWPKDKYYWPPSVFPHNPIYFLDGNHEDFFTLEENKYLNATEPQEILKNIFYIPRGTVVNIEGKNLLCCGGGDSIDKMYRNLGINWFPQEAITYANIQQCINQIKQHEIDYILTHVAPKCFDIQTVINLMPLPKSSSEVILNNLVEEVLRLENMPYWVFAHYHQHALGKYQKIAWRALGIGEVMK